MKNNRENLYLRDLVYLLKEELTAMDNNEVASEFEIGYKSGYNAVLDLIVAQAEVFNISLDEIGFYDFENYKKKN